MAKPNKTPHISVNKLGEYLVSRATRQNRILRDQKFPSDFITAYYRDAQEAIALFLAKNMEDTNILDQKLESLNQQPASSIYEMRKLSSNIDAVECFMNMLDDIDLMGATPKLGGHTSTKLMVRNVEVSVRPEVILEGVGKANAALVGGIKLHFPRANPLTQEAAGYVSAAMQIYCRDCLSDDAAPYGPYCMVLDVASATVWPGMKAIKQRQTDIENACAQIAALWPSITS